MVCVLYQPLTAQERRDYEKHTETVRRFLRDFLMGGNALREIQERRLYREEFPGLTWDQYCKQKWSIGRDYAYKLIAAAKVTESLSTRVDTVPETEKQARPLTQLDDPEEQAEAWKRIVETAPKDDDGKPKITAKHVQSVVDDMLGDEGSRTWTVEQKRAFVIGTAFKRRNLSPDQKKQLAKEQKRLCKALRRQDVKQWTQTKLASMLGVDRATVSRWLDGNNVQTHNTSKPDARVKLNPVAKDTVARRVEAGESKDQVAADFGVTPRTVRTVVKAKRKQRAAIAAEQASVAESPVESFIYHCDFRKLQDIAGQFGFAATHW